MNGKAILAALAICAAAALVWRLWGRAPPRPPAAPAEAPAPTSEFRGVELTNQDADGTRWRVSAQAGTAWETQTSGKLKGVDAVFEKKGRALRVHAGQGEVVGGNVVTLSDGVSARWEAYEAKMDHATYRRGDGTVVSDSPVKLWGPGLSVEGRGIEVDVEGQRAKILGGVRAVVQGTRP